MKPNGEFVAPKTSESFSRSDYVPPKVYRRDTPHVPSLVTTGHFVDKVEPMRYTGTLIKGIATMHKSNAVPVISQEHAEQISKMRRG
jgi:hypothetical protein